MSDRFGYHGRILDVDLGRGDLRVEERDEDWWRRYPGGGLLAAHELLDRTPAGLDPFDPDAITVLTTSVVAGNLYPGLARFTAAAKSPLTGGIGEARCEGPFARALKGAGVDAVVLRGRAATPTVLVIDSGEARLVGADHLWGLTVGQAMDELQSALGTGLHAALIGPAGERLVRYASVVADRGYQAARMGIGAVWGSKALKGIAVLGSAHPDVAHPERGDAIAARYAAGMEGNPLTRWQLEPPGFSCWVHLHGTDAALCTRNYRDSVFEHAPNYGEERFLERYRHAGVCPGCPNECIKFFAAGGSDLDVRQGGIHQEATGALGSNLGMPDPEFVFRANILCNELGLDPNSLGFTLSMAMECLEEGVLDEREVGLPLRFGNADAAEQMIRLIASREGFGDLLAEGTHLAAERIGRGAERFALHVKGLEMVPFEPRTQINLALGYATAPIGPRYEICEHDWDFDTEVGWPHSLELARTLGVLERSPMQKLSFEKVARYKALNTIWSAADALDISIFAIAPTRLLGLHDLAELVGAVTGWETSSYELMRFGEKRNHLMRVYNLREGLGPEDDTLPDRFFEEPLRQGKWEGLRIDRDHFHECIGLYYSMMGWDERGRPRPATLVDHGLRWATAD
jgi:aldehyde:ferredoxin oxidoreductase